MGEAKTGWVRNFTVVGKKTGNIPQDFKRDLNPLGMGRLAKKKEEKRRGGLFVEEERTK